MGLDVWDLATKTYNANFPEAETITDCIENVDVGVIGKIFRPDVLLTSPECTSHSIARGARPGLESSRETAIGIVPWIKSMQPRWVIVENVNRMKKWDRHNELIGSIESLGYKVSDLHLNAADFGAAQSRRRMFLICDLEGTAVSKDELLKFRRKRSSTARDIVEWNTDYPTAKLYGLGRAKATLERAERAIAALGRKVPFIIVYYGSDYAGGWQTLDVPLRTVTTIDRFGLVTWNGNTPYLRMLQPKELSRAMGGGREHKLPYGNRREKVKLCGNGVCAEVMSAIFKYISSAQKEVLSKKSAKRIYASLQPS